MIGIALVEGVIMKVSPARTSFRISNIIIESLVNQYKDFKCQEQTSQYFLRIR